jgi:hypothetical protein
MCAAVCDDHEPYLQVGLRSVSTPRHHDRLSPRVRPESTHNQPQSCSYCPGGKPRKDDRCHAKGENPRPVLICILSIRKELRSHSGTTSSVRGFIGKVRVVGILAQMKLRKLYRLGNVEPMKPPVTTKPKTPEHRHNDADTPPATHNELP